MSSSIDSEYLNVSSSGDYINQSNGIVFTISAPGKIILHGEHSVVHGKLALAASLGLRTSLTLRENPNLDDENSSIELNFPDINLHYSFNIKEIQNLLDKPLPTTSIPGALPLLFNIERPHLLNHDLHLKNVEGFLSGTPAHKNLDRVQKNALSTFLYLFVALFGPHDLPKLRPFRLSAGGQLTTGAGTGSSASFAVCLVAGTFHYLKLMVRRGDFGEHLSKKGYDACGALLTEFNGGGFVDEDLAMISAWGFMAEKIHHGNPSGIDNSVCTYGSLVAFKKCRKLQKRAITYPLKLMLINTKVSRDTKALVTKFADYLRKYPSVGQYILEAMDEISKNALECIETLGDCDDTADPERINRMFETLGDLAETNHGLLGIMGVSHPKLEDIVRILKSHNLKGKLTGAGGGGYAICLVPHSSGKNVDDAFEDLKMAGYDVRLTVLGDVGVRIDA